MNCPDCNTENADDASRCSHCLKVLNFAPSTWANQTSLGSSPAIQSAAAVAEPAYAASTSPPPSFSPPTEIRPYRPSGAIPTRGLLMLIAATVLIAATIGYGYYWIARVAYWVTAGKLGFVIAFLFGLGIGAVFGQIARLGKIRNPIVVTIFALLTTLLVFCARIEYRAYDPAIRMSVAVEKLAEAPNEQAAKAILKGWRHPNPVAAFSDYVYWLSNGHLVDTSDGRPITGFFFWFDFLIAPLGLVVGAALSTYKSARRQFCEQCDTWTKEYKLLKNHPSVAVPMAALVRQGDWQRARSMPLCGAVDAQNHCDLVVTRCESCRDSYVTLHSTVNSKERQIFYGRIEPELANVLIQP